MLQVCRVYMMKHSRCIKYRYRTGVVLALQVCGMQDMCDSEQELEAKLCRDLDKALGNKGG